MNIGKRLEKLEKTSNLDNPNCTCPRETRTRVILPNLGRTEEELLRERAELQRPEYCERCRKLIEKRLIIVGVVSSKIEKPDY